MSRTAEAGSASLARVVADAERIGLEIAPLRLEEGSRTAADAARACGCAVAQIVKSIIFRVEHSDRHVLFLTAGDRRIDPARAGALAGTELVKADAGGVRAHTGFAIGGVAPIGHLTPIETWLDPSLLGHDTVWAAAGTPHHVFAVSPGELATAIGARIGDFTDGPPAEPHE